MKVIFLDIDGVCNSDATINMTSEGWIFVDDIFIKRIKQIVDATDAKIVLSSTWREEWEKTNEAYNSASFNELRDKFLEFGMTFYDKTRSFTAKRWKEIELFIDEHPEIAQFVIIDDFENMENFEDHFVKTIGHLGIQDENVAEAIRILNSI